MPADSFKPGLYTCQVNIIDEVAGRFAFPRLEMYVPHHETLNGRTRLGVPHGANERTGFVDRQRGHVRAEGLPGAVLAQILLDIRHVERRDRRAAFSGEVADGAKGLWTGEVADDRHQGIPALEILHERKRLFARQIAAGLTRLVGGGHQIGIGRLDGAAEAAVRRVLNLRPRQKKHVVDRFDAHQVVAAQRKAMDGDELIANRRQRLGGKPIVRLDAGKRVEDLGGRRFRREPGGAPPRQQARHEVGAIRRQLEQRLVHQVQIDVAPPEVEDEREPRPQRRNIGEVLLGADAE